MPQMNKGGKFIFGESLIREDLSVHLPPQAIAEYNICVEKRIYLFTGSKSTGGFCITRKGLLQPSKLGHILDDNPDLQNYVIAPGIFIKYKGRSYCWIPISDIGVISLTIEMMKYLNLKIGIKLLSIRSSDIAFTMGAKGALLEKAKDYDGKIEVF